MFLKIANDNMALSQNICNRRIDFELIKNVHDWNIYAICIHHVKRPLNGYLREKDQSYDFLL